MTPLLGCLLVALSLAQKNQSNKMIALTFTVSAILISHYVTFHPDYFFLLSALSEGTGICLMLNAVQLEHNRLALKLQAMCLVLVALQCSFYTIWYLGITTIAGFAVESIYAYTWTAYYLMVCAILTKESGSFGTAIEYSGFRGFSVGLRKCNGPLYREA